MHQGASWNSLFTPGSSPFGSGNISSTTVIHTPGKEKLLDETQHAIQTIFKKKVIPKTKQYIEEHVLADRATIDDTTHESIPYIGIWQYTVKALSKLQKWTEEDKLNGALKKIRDAIRTYYDNTGYPNQFLLAIKEIPYEIRKDSYVQKLFGTLFKNTPALVSFYNEMTKLQMSMPKQATFPGWESITTDGQNPYIRETTGDNDDYMMVATNIRPWHMEEAKKWGKKQKVNIYGK